MSKLAAVVIGNEVLTGKVQDANGTLLIRRCAEAGISLAGLAIVPDDVDTIVAAVIAARRRSEWIITSGGIGPTHDDVSVRAVALALGRRVVQHPELLRFVDDKVHVMSNAAVRRLAEAPEGTMLLPCPDALRYPVMCVDNVHLLAGVPQLFSRQLEVVLARIPARRRELRTLFVSKYETELVSELDAVAHAFPAVSIGSYPVFDPSLDYRVRLTVEHPEASLVDEVVERLRSVLAPGSIVREE